MSHADDIEQAIENIVDNRIISALDDYDPTTSYLFEQGVESIVDSRIDNLDMDALGIQEYINEGLRAHLFSSNDVEDFDSAVLSILQDEIDRVGPVDAPNNSDIERRVNDLEIQVASLLETNRQLLSALSGRVNDLEIQVDVPTFPPYAAVGI